MAGFTQIIEWKSSRIDDIQKLSEEFRAGVPERGIGPSRVTVLADRDRENTYLTIAEFESREIAEQNSARPETSEFAARMAELCDGPPTFLNLDVLQSDVL